MSKLQHIRNYLAGILFLAAVALSLWPLRATIIEDMFWHMDIQIPLLIVVGAMIKISAPALYETLSRFNAYGLNSFIASQVILAFWMLLIWTIFFPKRFILAISSRSMNPIFR